MPKSRKPPSHRHFNRLTPEELEALAYTVEESAELIVAVCKALRHGLESHNPEDSPLFRETNRQMIAREAGDARVGLELLMHTKIFSGTDFYNHFHEKLNSVGQWLHHIDLYPSTTPTLKKEPTPHVSKSVPKPVSRRPRKRARR